MTNLSVQIGNENQSTILRLSPDRVVHATWTIDGDVEAAAIAIDFLKGMVGGEWIWETHPAGQLSIKRGRANSRGKDTDG